MEANINREMKILVALITSEIKTREEKKSKWAQFKNENESNFRTIQNIPEGADVKASELIGFDIDSEKSLILLNYTSQAHNILHEIDGGWTPQLRAMRGLVYYFGPGGDIDSIRLVSRGFEKFFNQSELPETSIEALRERCGNDPLVCKEKADGHMIEYFLHDSQLCATTRGKFGTISSGQALTLFNRGAWIKADLIARSVGTQLMSLVVELITPESEVHVDYDGAETLYLLAAFDSDGNKINDVLLSDIAGSMPEFFRLPETRLMSLDQILEDISDRSIVNKEGWVADCKGQLVKFKYETYIGKMVASKLSYKYVMRCIQNDRFEKMMCTLPEEIREVADIMKSEVEEKLVRCELENSYKPLYDLHSQLDGGVDYFRTICREFWREYGVNHSHAQLELNLF